MIFHYRQRVLTQNDIPCLMINNTLIERVTEFNFLGLTVNECMNWNSHVQKIANKISRTLGVRNKLKRYLPISAMKLMYDSLILSHPQFGITNWGFERDRISKLQKRALRIMTNSRYNAHTEPLFKQLYLLKVKDIFDVQCMNVPAVHMMTSSSGSIFRVTGPLCGEFAAPGDFPAQRPVTRSFDVFFICAWINDWVNNHEAGDLRHHRGHYDIIVMQMLETYKAINRHIITMTS